MPSGGIESVDFVITDFKLQISLKSLVNISKSSCLKVFEQTPQQPFRQPRWVHGKDLLCQ